VLTRLVKHNNDLAIIIDDPILEKLQIKSNTALNLSTDGVNIIISIVKEMPKTNTFESSLDNINRKHSRSLSKLAKSGN
jgi:antitoxin component of MazEF toxin-antitoxin module